MATVLYVDDDAAVAKAVSLWLTRKGHVVHVAHDAETARAIVARTRLDGVFVDLWLGADSGVALLEWIVAHEPALHGFTAVVTGDLFEAPRRGGGSWQVFTKPFDLRALEDQAEAWGRARGRGRDGGGTGPAPSLPRPRDETSPRPGG